MNIIPKWLVRGATVLAAAAVGIVGLSACARTAVAGKPSNTLTIALSSAPLSLDPAQAQNSSDGQAYTDLAYSPLITLTASGSLAPGLATSWRYLNKSLTSFELTLRRNARFSDGSSLTAEDVIRSIQRAQKGSGVAAPYAVTIKSMRAPNASTVVLSLSQPDPTIADVLTQRYLVGSIVGAKGLADPASLGTTTDGAGPYMLDVSQTVANEQYTYVPNPYYWNKSAIHFKKFTVKVIANPQTAYNALRSGQASYIGGSFTTVDEAKSAGYAIHSALSDWYGIFLLDRNGALVPALAKPAVRQALSYAIDRPAITKALFDGFGVPTDEISDSAYSDDGYDAGYVDHYSYDPAKAKRLLAAAGYPHGFSLTVGATATYGDGVEVAQAIASDWAAIGVTTKIKTFPNLSAFAAPLEGKKLPAFAGNLDVQPMYLESTQILDRNAGFFNAFLSVDPKLSTLLATARRQTRAGKIAAAWAAVENQVVDLAWFVPVSAGPTQYFSVTSLKGIKLSAANFVPDPTLFHF